MGRSSCSTAPLNVTPPNDSEERSRLLAMVARQHLLAERPVAAADAAEQAVAQFPNYADALDALSDARAAEGKAAEELALRRQVVKLLPSPKYQYALARSLERSGKSDEADAAYKAFEARAAAEVGKPRNADRLLVLYYADRADRPADALAVAEQLAKRTRDVLRPRRPRLGAARGRQDRGGGGHHQKGVGTSASATRRSSTTPPPSRPTRAIATRRRTCCASRRS